MIYNERFATFGEDLIVYWCLIKEGYSLIRNNTFSLDDLRKEPILHRDTITWDEEIEVNIL